MTVSWPLESATSDDRSASAAPGWGAVSADLVQPLTLIACTKGAGVGGLILQKEAILTGPPDRHDHAIIAIFLENMRIGKF